MRSSVAKPGCRSQPATGTQTLSARAAAEAAALAAIARPAFRTHISWIVRHAAVVAFMRPLLDGSALANGLFDGRLRGRQSRFQRLRIVGIVSHDRPGRLKLVDQFAQYAHAKVSGDFEDHS